MWNKPNKIYNTCKADYTYLWNLSKTKLIYSLQGRLYVPMWYKPNKIDIFHAGPIMRNDVT